MSAGIKELEVFVKESLASGAKSADIEKAIIDAGWPPDQAKRAINSYVVTSFSIPVPRPRPSLSARDAFLYLVMFSALYLSVYNLGSLLFDIINTFFPDSADSSYRRDLWDTMRWSSSMLIIAFPLFLYVSAFITKEQTLNPTKRLSSVRYWITYLTLFVAVCLLIGDMTTLVYFVLGGELTIRFVLKVLVVAGLASTTLGYYLWDLKVEEKECTKSLLLGRVWLFLLPSLLSVL